VEPVSDVDKQRIAAIARKWAQRSAVKARYEQVHTPSELAPFGPGTRCIRVACVTWNMHGKCSFEASVSEMFQGVSRAHVYVLGTAECERSIQKSFLRTAKPRWEKAVKGALGEDYECVCVNTLVATNLMVLAHKDVVPFISGVKLSYVATGIKKILGNKGGVQASMKIGATRFLFIATHLPSGHENVAKRNQSAARILGARHAEDQAKPAIEGHDRVFLLGDLNYRLELSREEAELKIMLGDHAALIKQDQLLDQLRGVPVWADFVEAQVCFPPTYKFDDGGFAYDTKKFRIPSWTDRILWRTCADIVPRAYDSLKNITMSDHRPVFAEFDVGIADSEQPVSATLGKKPVRSAHRSGVCTVM